MAEYSNERTIEEPEKIDIFNVLVALWKQIKRTWILGVLLVILGTVALGMRARLSYVPMYRAYCDLIVNADSSQSTYVNRVTVQQLSTTFPYIVSSGALNKVIAEDLGLEALPASPQATVVPDTNLFEIYVTHRDPETAEAVLRSTLDNYQTVARYIIGSTTFKELDYSGVPTTPINGRSYRRAAAKGGMTAGAAYILLLVALVMVRKTVISAEDLKKYTQVKYLAGVPTVHLKKRIVGKSRLVAMISDDNAGSAFSESFSTMRIRVEKVAQEKGEKVFAFTSVAKDEGKTTVCCNLAYSFARKDYKVLLIDGDLRNPSVAGHLNMKAEKGLVDVLKGEVSVSDVIRTYKESSLSVLPGGKAVSATAGLYGKDNFSKLIEALKPHYDYIFIDTTPCGVMQDATMVAATAHNMIMVIRQDYSLRYRVLECMELISETGAEIVGYVINRESTGIGSYGYGKYGYGKYGYGKYGYGKYGYGKNHYGYGYGYGDSKEKKHHKEKSKN